MLPAVQWYRCSQCQKIERIGITDAAMRLSQLGMLRRAADPDPAVVFELFSAAIDRLPCSGCGHPNLRRCDAPKSIDDDFDWPEAKACLDCGAIISAERLEVLPTTDRCTACQNQDDRGVVADDDEFCPRCGDRMQVRSGGAGITRYRLVCPTCRR